MTTPRASGLIFIACCLLPSPYSVIAYFLLPNAYRSLVIGHWFCFTPFFIFVFTFLTHASGLFDYVAFIAMIILKDRSTHTGSPRPPLQPLRFFSLHHSVAQAPSLPCSSA